jgi:hypothetical protein
MDCYKPGMRKTIAVLVAAIVLMPAAASAQGASAAPPSAQALAQQPAEAAAAQRLEPGKVPRLAIRWSCGGCTVNEKVGPLIEAAYAQAAALVGQTVSDTEVAEVVIDDFRQRPPPVRVAFGFLAGMDRLGISIAYRGKVLRAHDYSANTLYGMNALCESVGMQAHQLIDGTLKAPPAR